MLKACKGIPREKMKAEDYRELAQGKDNEVAMEMIVRRLKGNAADVGVAVRPNASRLVRGVYTVGEEEEEDDLLEYM